MPIVEDIFSKLNGAKYFSILDLRAGYHRIPLDKSSIPETAFNSPFGKYEYVKVPFRLAQAPAYFQELMTGILKDFDFTIAYLDNILIFSKTAEEHLSHIKKVFEKFQLAKLSMKLSTCYFSPKKFNTLGHILSTKGYQKFIKDFAKIANLLTLLTRQQLEFEWTPAHHEAFLKLKDSIIQAPILQYPNPSKRYIVYTDASDDACRAQLTKEHYDMEFPITFLSHTF